ncbi:hypothetical protein NESM_000454500 [Novymonas esmeraldas]|uniref:Uncharacterized protein n=1 Tax=Novymonas esmeraldas TaxID=1808958 RepID=A0AAW0EMM4_9TRYP
MEAWVTASLAAKYIKAVDPRSVQSGVFCDAFTSPWYDGGVVFDWTALHQRLTRPPVEPASVVKAVNTLRRCGAEAVRAAAAEKGGTCFSTVVELREPWTLHPLSDQAQQLSVFDVAAGTSPLSPSPSAAASASAPAPRSARQLYTFLRGPPGQRAVRDDMARVLASAEAQLRDSGLRVVCFLSSFVLFGTDFTDLLHSTAAVFRALTEVGFTIDGHGSCLGPRVVTAQRLDSDDWWTTSPLPQLTSEEDVAALLVAVFFQWLQDAYVWGCSAALRLFPDATETLAAKGMRLFERFVRGLVLPRARAIGLDALHASLPEEGGSLFELAAAELERKRVPTGPQRWSVVERRVILAQIGAYAHIPSEYLARPASTHDSTR